MNTGNPPLPSPNTATAPNAIVPGRLIFHRDEPTRFGAIEVISQDGLAKGLSMKLQQMLPFEPEALLTAAQLAKVIIDLAGQAATPASADQSAVYARTPGRSLWCAQPSGRPRVLPRGSGCLRALAIQAIASKVTAYSKYKELELELCGLSVGCSSGAFPEFWKRDQHSLPGAPDEPA